MQQMIKNRYKIFPQTLKRERSTQNLKNRNFKHSQLCKETSFDPKNFLWFQEIVFLFR